MAIMELTVAQILEAKRQSLEFAIQSNKGYHLNNGSVTVESRNAESEKIVDDAKKFYEFIVSVTEF